MDPPSPRVVWAFQALRVLHQQGLPPRRNTVVVACDREIVRGRNVFAIIAVS